MQAESPIDHQHQAVVQDHGDDPPRYLLLIFKRNKEKNYLASMKTTTLGALSLS